MKMYLSLLKRFVEIPDNNINNIIRQLENLGLEVKNIELLENDTLFTIETLANRGDHLCALGIAREISAKNLSSIKTPNLSPINTDKNASVILRVNSKLCSRYDLLEIILSDSFNLRPEIKNLYRGSTKQAIVDVLNYVQLELGQPMHAFDRDKIKGEIIVEENTSETTISALDGKDYKIPEKALVIKDQEKIIAIAGVIGCSNSCVTEATNRVLIESAFFNKESIRITSKAMGISTDASRIFERGADPEMTITALRRLVHLMSNAEGESRVVGYTSLKSIPTEDRKINISFDSIRNAVNSPRLNYLEVTKRFQLLGFNITVDEKGKNAKVTVPSWRLHDVFNQDDMIEEFVRVNGLDQIKILPCVIEVELPDDDILVEVKSKYESLLHGNGYQEVITRSYYSKDDVECLGNLGIPKNTHIGIKNSVEKKHSDLRITQALHHLEVIATNQRREVKEIKIYEIASIFSYLNPKEKGLEIFEKEVLGITLCDANRNALQNREEDFLKFKDLVLRICSVGNCKVATNRSEVKILHPGISCDIFLNRKKCGYFGLLHPSLTEKLKIKTDAWYAEINLEDLFSTIKFPKYQEPQKFPTITRDLTFKVKPIDDAGVLVAQIQKLGLKDCAEVNIHNWFSRAEERFKRLTYRLIFKNPDKTLEAKEVDEEIQRALVLLKEKYEIELLT
jgi:phenylalanyl-tRNA synthetase beta chain